MTFPVNVEALTVWAKDVSGRAPVYTRHVLGPSYWQDCRGQAADGRTPDDNTFAAIPVGSISDYVPKKDDRIVTGTSESAAPPPDALTVMQVKNFLYASAMMQHVELTLK